MKDYLRYTGMAFELFALLLILIYIGKKLDAYFGFEKSYLLMLLVTMGLMGYLAKIYFETTKKGKNDK